MARLKTAGLRWASGLFLAVLGAMMLVTPHQFNSPIYDVLRPFLGLVGIAFLITGIALIALGSFQVHRAVDRTVHVLAGIELLILTAAVAAAHSWTGTANFVALALGTLAAAFLAGRSDKSHSGNSANLLMLTVATGAGLAGLVMIVAPGIFSSRIFDTFRAFMFWVALAFLIGGLALAYVQLAPPVPRLVYWLGHLACGSAFLWFFFVSALPLHAWIGMIYYGGFGLMILSFPALEPRLRRIDPASLEVRLAMAMGAATTVALVVAVALTAGLVFGSSATGAAEAALRTARDISFIVLVVIVAMVVIAGILLARYFAEPIEHLARAADRLSGGDTSAPLPASDVTEMAHLTKTFGEMRERLTARTNERERLLSELQATNSQLAGAVLEREGLLEEVSARRQEAEEAVRQRDAFLSVASHELKTPLTSLMGFAQLLQKSVGREGVVNPERLNRSLTVITQQTDKLAQLINQLLDVSRIESGKLVLDEKPTDVVSLAKAIAADAQTRTGEHHIAISAPGCVEALVDPLRLEQVLTNLLDNAIKFSPNGGEIKLEVGSLDGRGVSIAVQDQGVGIPAEHRGELFNRFFQAHKAGYSGGMGLGLFISKEIVELHGGTIRAEFPEEGGTRFVVAIPKGQGARGQGERG